MRSRPDLGSEPVLGRGTFRANRTGRRGREDVRRELGRALLLHEASSPLFLASRQAQGWRWYPVPGWVEGATLPLAKRVLVPGNL